MAIVCQGYLGVYIRECGAFPEAVRKRRGTGLVQGNLYKKLDSSRNYVLRGTQFTSCGDGK